MDGFCNPSSRSRPITRSPRNISSQSKTPSRKRTVSGEHARSPSVKSSKHTSGGVSSDGQAPIIDYFDYTNPEEIVPRNSESEG